MDKDGDFTFFQVRPAVDQDAGDANGILPDISGINLNGEVSDTAGDDHNGFFSWKHGAPNNTSSKKPEKVGSLSFNVIDTSQAPSGELSRQLSSEDTLSSVKVCTVPKPVARKPAPRAKVPFEKGYSPIDWLKLTQRHPDLAGLKGQSNRRLISMNEVKQHTTEGAMWTVLKGRVYNLSPYLKFHPGGVDMIMNAVGKDCTFLFNKYHAWVNAEFLLERCIVGVLDDSH